MVKRENKTRQIVGETKHSVGKQFYRERQPLEVNSKEFWVNYFRNILAKSSVHGLNHITQPHRHLIEQLMWAGWLAVCLLGAITISLSTWRRYRENPTVTSMERNYLDWNTTFPSSAICPTKKYDPILLRLKAQVLFPKNINRGVEFLKALSEVTIENMWLPDDIGDHLDSKQYLQTILDIKFNLSYTVSNSNSKTVSLQPAITEMGICYYYNSVAAVYNNPSYWTSNNWTVEESVQVFVGNPLDGDIFAQILDMNSGFRVWIQGPGEPLNPASRSFTSPQNHYVSVLLTVLSIYPSPSLASLDLTQRKCRYTSESDLDISPYYSYNMCRIQCRIRLARSLCACVPHFYRPVKGYRICDSFGLRCLSRYKDMLIKLRDTKGKVDCKCYPPCDEVIYSVHSHSNVQWFLGTNFKYGLVSYPRLRLKRDILFGSTDLLVQFGGTAGLFLGCSLLSIFEIIYFLLLRPVVVYIYYKLTR